MGLHLHSQPPAQPDRPRVCQQLAGAAAFAGCLRHLCLNCQPWVQWEKVKKAGMAPGARASFGMAVHKNRG